MRTWMLAAVTLLAVGLFDARPASAAWSCIGPEYVCGSATKVSSDRAERRSARHHHKARGSAATTASWWNDEPAAPSRKSRKKRSYETASNFFDSADEARPRRGSRQRQARSYDSDFGSSWGGGSHYQSGMASYYHEPQRVASGGWFNPNAMTAAHKSLPFGTKVRVTNKRNGQSVVVTINDRGPYVGGRVIDLSAAAAGAISMKGAGVAPVSIAVLGR